MVPIEEIAAIPSVLEEMPPVQEVAGLPIEDFIIQFRQLLAEDGNAVWETNTTELGYGFPPDIEREIYNSPDFPTMIHEDDHIPHPCVFCGVEIDSVHHSHNPYPIFGSTHTECYPINQNGTERPLRCCSVCENEIVMPTRLRAASSLRAANLTA
jgi:hypothetical protein